MVQNIARSRITALVIAHDLFMAAIAYILGFFLRLGEDLPTYPLDVVLWNTVVFTGVAALVYPITGLHRGLWRYASLNDLINIVKAATVVVVVYFPVSFVLTRLEGVPRSLLLIDWILLCVLLGAPRLIYRIIHDGHFSGVRMPEVDREASLIIGGGDEAELFIRTLNRNPALPYEIVGIVDTIAQRVGYEMHGVQVVGEVSDDFHDLFAKLSPRPTRLIFTSDLPGKIVQQLIDFTEGRHLEVSRMPKLTELRHGGQLELRPIQLEDLLNRQQAELDREGMQHLICERRVLITGAGGSIGSEMVRQISDFGPTQLVLVENSEFALYTIEMEIRRRHPDLSIAAVIGDVRNPERIEAVFKTFSPELVFHAAALKHVPMVELNPTEGVLTNVNGTRNLANACVRHNVRAMVMISTDKAVNPTNIMGATKRAGESYCQALDIAQSTSDGTRFTTVRFGNVLGSKGSVVPLFEAQLARGGPLTVTHPDIERFFMTIHEAVELVLQAAVLRCSGEDEGGKLFVLDMGDPIRVQDLARQMIQLAGLRPNVDVDIVFTGLRPGEKLYEELFHDAEKLVPTTVGGIRLASPRVADVEIISDRIDRLVVAARQGDFSALIATLHELVPEYHEPDHHRDASPQHH